MASKSFDKDTKKQEILHAALKAFARNGVAKTKMEDIAEIAGIGKGTIYEYFRSKEDIFIESYNQFSEAPDKKIKQIIQSDNGPDVKLKLFVDETVCVLLRDNSEFIGILFEFWSEAIKAKNEKVFNVINFKCMYQTFRKAVTDILDEGVKKGIFRPMDTRLAASVFLSMTDGVILQWIMDPEAFTPEEISDIIIDTFFNGTKLDKNNF